MTKPIEGADYFVRVVDLTDTVDAAVRPNDDGTYSVYINTRASSAAQYAAMDHELQHIVKDDFNNEKPISEIEHRQPKKQKKPHENRRAVDPQERARVQSLIRQAWTDDHIRIIDAEDAMLEDLEETLAWLKSQNDNECSLDWS